jgi:hypothetical protein
MERPTFEAMLEAAIGVERDGSEYTVAEGYGLSVYIGKPGQAMEVSEVVGLRLDAAFCEATSREHSTVYYVEYSNRALRSAAEWRWRTPRRFQLGDSAGAVGWDKPPGRRPDRPIVRGRWGGTNRRAEGPTGR